MPIAATTLPITMMWIRFRSNAGFWPIEGRISSEVNDHAIKPIALKTTPGESRRNANMISNPVSSRFALSAKINAQAAPALKQTQKVSPPITVQNETPSHAGIVRCAAPQNNATRNEIAPSAGKIQSRGPLGETPRKTP